MTIEKDMKGKVRPAGKNDNFTIVGMDINNVFNKDKKLELKTSKKGVKVEALSTELSENVTIKAYDGTKNAKIAEQEK